MLRWLGRWFHTVLGDGTLGSISSSQPLQTVLAPKRPDQTPPPPGAKPEGPGSVAQQVASVAPQAPPTVRDSVQSATTRQPLIDEQAMTGVLNTLKSGKPLDEQQRHVVANAAHALDKFLLQQADGDPNIARKLAMNPNTPPSVLTQLAAGHSDKMMVVALLVENPSTPRAALNKIHDSVLANPDISQETRAKVLESVEQHPHARRSFSLVQRNILTAMAGEKDLDKVVAKLREKDPGSLRNVSDADLKKMIVESPEYKKEPTQIRISSSRLKQLDGNVKLKFMLEAAPELYSPALMKPTIDRLTSEKTGLTGDIAGLKEKLTALRAELKDMKDGPAKNEKKEELNTVFLDLKNKETRLQEVDGKLGEIAKGLKRASELTVGKGHMAYDSVKKEFLKDGTDRRQFAMEAVIDFRREFVMATYKGVVADLKKEAIGKLQGELTALESKQPRDEQAIAKKKTEMAETADAWDKIDVRAVGSTDLTSDFDMTVIAKKAGMDTAVMKEVNNRFQAQFGKEAGSVFDTNLYVAGSGPAIKQEVKDGPKQWANADAKLSHDEGQDIASLVKQRLYSSPEQWKKFVDGMAEGLEKKLRAVDPPIASAKITELVNAQKSRFDAADTMYKDRKTAIEGMVAELKKLPEHQGKSAFDLEITAMNRLFEKYSAEADVKKKEWESTTNPSDKDKKWAEYTRLDCRAQLYANEPYFSEGPVRHVVGNEQALKGLKMVKGEDGTDRFALKPEQIDGKKQALQIEAVQALQSANENLGDSFKEFEHLHGKPPGEIAIKASKYMGRLTRAIELALPDKKDRPPEMQALIEKLQGAEVELLRIRKGGQLPEGETDKNAYAVKVLKANGLEHLDTAEKMQDCFEKLKLEAEILIRFKLSTSG